MARDWSMERSDGDHGVSSTNTSTPMNVIDYGQYNRSCQCPPSWWGTVPPYCPVHNPRYTIVPCAPVQTFTWPSPEPQRLSDEDVKRIAREVVRQMQRAGHDPGDEDGR